MEILTGIMLMVLILMNAVLVFMVLRKDRSGKPEGGSEQLHRDIDELKRIFTGVKTRGIWGEWQLGSILEETLTREQYETE